MEPLTVTAISSILSIGQTLIKRLFPDPADQAKAELALFDAAQRGELRQVEIQLSAIIAEAKSKDPYTSRARPSFLYVMYIMILASIPMGILYVFAPDHARLLIDGMQFWLTSIPEALWALFGAGYLGYVGARSFDKNKQMGLSTKAAEASLPPIDLQSPRHR